MRPARRTFRSFLESEQILDALWGLLHTLRHPGGEFAGSLNSLMGLEK